jgi:hypothetical protein
VTEPAFTTRELKERITEEIQVTDEVLRHCMMENYPNRLQECTE